MFNSDTHLFDSYEVQQAFLGLDQRWLYNNYRVHQWLADFYRPYMAGEALVSVGRTKTLNQVAWAIPYGLDMVAPEFAPSYNYIAAFNNTPPIAPSYPLSDHYWRFARKEPSLWAEHMPAAYIDCDIAPIPRLPDNLKSAALIPTASIEIPESPDELFACYSKVRRKGYQRRLRQAEDTYTFRRGTLDDLRPLLRETLDLWSGRERNLIIPVEDYLNGYIEFLRMVQTDIQPGNEDYTEVVVNVAERDGAIRAANALIYRHHRYSDNRLETYLDDYLVWRCNDEQASFGSVFFHRNITEWADLGPIYNLGSGYSSGEPIPHHEYKAELMPESFQLLAPATARLPSQVVADALGFQPPYHLAGI